MDDATIAAGIARWDRWHYEFDLRGQRTPIHDPTRVNRHRQRKAYFFDPVVRLAGGSLAGKRVLDLGCNAGFWALAALGAGADFVYGVDARQMHVDQANFVFEALEVGRGRYEFEAGNVFDVDLGRHGPYDLVLFLGLLYHVAKPVALMERVAAVSDDLLVIDTRITERLSSTFDLVFEGTADPRNAAELGLVMRPSEAAVIDMVHVFGYRTVVLEPHFGDYTGAEDYRTGIRKAFVCAKRTRLSRRRLGVAR